VGTNGGRGGRNKILRFAAGAGDGAIAGALLHCHGARKLFGGLALLIHGNMAIALGSQGAARVRVDRAQSNALVARTTAAPIHTA
jgi:hypothetical protein